jgi:hypothetical protein
MVANGCMNMEDSAMQATCSAARHDGTPCRVPALASGYCFAHDPALAEKRAAARVAGGKGKARAARAQKRLPTDLRGVLGRLLTALDETHAGELEPRVASAMSALASAISRIYEVAELEERLEKLEGLTNERRAF